MICPPLTGHCRGRLALTLRRLLDKLPELRAHLANLDPHVFRDLSFMGLVVQVPAEGDGLLPDEADLLTPDPPDPMAITSVCYLEPPPDELPRSRPDPFRATPQQAAKVPCDGLDLCPDHAGLHNDWGLYRRCKALCSDGKRLS